MKSKFTKFALMAAYLLFSCTNVERDNPYDSGGVNYIGDNNINNYRTVRIGEQVWMAENLNYAVRGSKCRVSEHSDELSDATTASCYEFGRLYSWATAMALPDSCNKNSCKSQISAKHKGICPKFWHIPSNEDWKKLIRYVDSEAPQWSNESETAGKYLKATRGWGGENGTDDYGFSALPSDGIGMFGVWLSSTESDRLNAYNLVIHHSDNKVGYYSDKKSDFYSVRCLKD